jgi:hypothetical protein
VFSKTLVHPTHRDVEEGRTTTWELKGNGTADMYAKKGMSLHAVPKATQDEFFGLVALVKAACTWAGVQEAWMADDKRSDCQALDGMKDVRNGESKSSLPASLDLVDDRGAVVRTHQLVTAEVLPKGQGRVFGCMLCGSFAWKRRGKLVEACPRRPTSKYMRAQLARLEDQCFPGEQTKAIGPLRQLEPAELEWLTRCSRAPQGVAAVAAAATVERSRQRVLGPEELLQEFGIFSQVQMEEWKAVALNEVEEEAQEICSDSD